MKKEKGTRSKDEPKEDYRKAEEGREHRVEMVRASCKEGKLKGKSEGRIVVGVEK